MHLLVTSLLYPEDDPGLTRLLGAYFKDFRGPSLGRSWVSRITPLSFKKLSDRLERKEQRSVEAGGFATVAVWSLGSWDREPNPSTRSHLCAKHMGHIDPLPQDSFQDLWSPGSQGWLQRVPVWGAYLERKSLSPPGLCRVSDVNGKEG